MTRGMLCGIAFSLSFVGAVTAGGTTEWTNPVSGRWDDPQFWSAGVPDRFIDILINATGAAYTISPPSQDDIVSGRSLLLDSDDATLSFVGNGSALTVHMHDLTLRRGFFIADRAIFTPGTDVILDGAQVRFGSATFRNSASLGGLALIQDTDFDLRFNNAESLRTDVGTTGGAFGLVKVETSLDVTPPAVFEHEFTGWGQIFVRDARGIDESHLILAETARTSGWSLRATEITNYGTIESTASGDAIGFFGDSFTNHGTILALAGGIETELAITNHGTIELGESGGFVAKSIENLGSISLGANSYARIVYDVGRSGSINSSGDIQIGNGAELTTGVFTSSGIVNIQGGLLRTGHIRTGAFLDGQPNLINTGSIVIGAGGTLLAHNTTLDMLGDVTSENGGRVMFGSLDLLGRTIDDFDTLGGAFFLGADGVISNGVIDFGDRADAFVSEKLGHYPGNPAIGPTDTTFRNVHLRNGTLSGANLRFESGTTLSGIDLDLAGVSATWVGDGVFGGRLFSSDGQPLEFGIESGTLSFTGALHFDSDSTEITLRDADATLRNQGIISLSGPRRSAIEGRNGGTVINEGIIETSGELWLSYHDLLDVIDNVYLFRVLEGGRAYLRSLHEFRNSGTLEVRQGASITISSGWADGVAEISEIGDVLRHRDSTFAIGGAPLDLEGTIAAIDPNAGDFGGLFHGVVISRHFTNGQLGVEGGLVRIGFGQSIESSRIDNMRLRGTVELVIDGSPHGIARNTNLFIGSDVDMAGATILVSYSDALAESWITFESDLAADVRVEFIPGSYTPLDFLLLNKAGTLEIAEGRSITGDRFQFGRDTERVINRGRIEADRSSAVNLARAEGFGGLSTDFELINYGEIIESGGGGTHVFGTRLVNHGLVAVRDGGVFSVSAALDNRGDLEVTGAGSLLDIRSTPIQAGGLHLADGATVFFDADITIDHLTGITRSGDTTVRIGRDLDLLDRTLGFDTAQGPLSIDGGVIRNGTVDLSGDVDVLRFIDQGGFEHDPIDDFLAGRANTLRDLRVEGGTLSLDTQVLLVGVEAVSNVENLGVLAAPGGVVIGGDLLLAETSTLVITASVGEAGELRFDRFHVIGSATLDGLLVLDFDLASIDPTELGGLYTFISSAAYLGRFTGVDIRGIDPGLITVNEGNGSFRIVPAPATAAILVFVFGMGISRRRAS